MIWFLLWLVLVFAAWGRMGFAVLALTALTMLAVAYSLGRK